MLPTKTRHYHKATTFTLVIDSSCSSFDFSGLLTCAKSVCVLPAHATSDAYIDVISYAAKVVETRGQDE